MIFPKKAMCLAALGVSCISYAYSQAPQSSVTLADLSAFKPTGDSWVSASAVSADIAKPQTIKFTKGGSILLNTAKKNGGELVSNQEFGDAEIDLDFLIANTTVSDIYLQGRYAVKLADSWTKQKATLTDLGAVEPFAGADGRPVGGSVPFLNVAKAPGLWQHIKIKFRAPVFANGVKVKNARFEEVMINGVTLQVENELSSPTLSALYKDEKATGPLVIQANNGSIAVKNITYKPLPPLPAPNFGNPIGRRRMPTVNPIILNPDNEPKLLRGFLMFNNKKRTHVISFGDPRGINFSYDLKQGAMFQIWRGQFLDVTEMWEDRGEPQLAKPIGAVIPLSVAPAVAVLPNSDAAWTDSIAFDDMQNKGYELDKARMPTFVYTYLGADVSDKISVESSEALTRTVSVTNAPDNFYFRIAAAPVIEKSENGVFLIGNQQYYIKAGEGTKPVIRNTTTGQELIVPLKKGADALSYSLIW